MIPRVAVGLTQVVRDLGHEPVVHIAARRIRVGEPAPTEPKEWMMNMLFAGPPDLDLVLPARKSGLARVFKAYELDLVLCTAFPWRLPAAALAVPRLGVVNGHPSKLPDYRGPMPFSWQIRDGLTEFGLTYHLMDEQYDTGSILAQGTIPFADDDTQETVWTKLGALSAELLPVVFARLAAGERGDSQEGGSYQSLFEDDYVPVDLTKTAREVHNQVRAWEFTFFSKASERGPILERGGERIRLLKSSMAEVDGAERLDCADGPLWLLETEPA
jgi:methionyl-tRNA formyltransferase